MESKKISVILPVRDGNAEYLKKAIQSVLFQSYGNFELLLLNDGSCDEFAAKMKMMSLMDDRIRYYSLVPSGVSKARNFGIRKSQGDYITFLDGDDLFSPRYFEEAVRFMECGDVDVIFGGTLYIKDEDRTFFEENIDQKMIPAGIDELKICSILLDEKRIHLSKAECVGEPYRFEKGGYINRGIAARFIKREVFLKNQHLFLSKLRFYEDAIWNLQLIRSCRVSYVCRIWYYYFENMNSVSNRFNPDVVSDMETPLAILRKCMDLRDETEYKAYTQVLMDSLRYVYKCLYGHKDWNASKEERDRLRYHLENEKPWREIGTKRYRKAASQRDRMKSVLYKEKLLLPYWKVKE